jgi:phosphinothricin acetyltransferase
MITALAAFNGDQATVQLDDLRRDLLGPSPWLVVMVASIHTSLIGYAALCPLARLQFGQRGMDIHHPFVEAAYRGQGVGKALLQASVREVEAMGCSYVKIATSDSNLVAQKAYLAAGFELEAVRGPKYKMNLKPFSPPSSS